MPNQHIPENIFDQIGIWSEIKLEIIKKYSKAYSTILAKHNLKHIYIDAFAGTGIHRSKTSGELIPGSPLNALETEPPFYEYHFIDKSEQKVEVLKDIAESKPNLTVFVHHGDCNELLITEVFPRVRYEDFKRGLCFLDPYGLHLDWTVIKKAGEMKTFDIFINFPLLDMNRNVLLCDPKKAQQKEIEKMNRFWGDSSWREATYSQQTDLFGQNFEIKNNIKQLIKLFRLRLKENAGFPEVPEPIPMKNKQGGTLYYLFFASQVSVASKIARDLFKSYRIPGL